MEEEQGESGHAALSRPSASLDQTKQDLDALRARVQNVLAAQEHAAKVLQDTRQRVTSRSDLNTLYGEAAIQLTSKAKGIVRDMEVISRRLANHETRATRLQLLLQRRALEEEQRREAEELKDKQLRAKVVTENIGGDKVGEGEMSDLQSNNAAKKVSSKRKKSKPRVVDLDE